MLRRSSAKKSPESKSEHKTSISTESEKLDYYDDSSDEEEIENKLANYDIAANWQKREKEIKSLKKDYLNNNDILSFAAHAAGLKLFYSTSVNQIYYPLKKTILGKAKATETAEAQLKNLIKKGLIDSANKTLESIIAFISRAENREIPKSRFEKIFKKVLAEFNVKIDNLIAQYVSEFANWSKSIKFNSTAEKPAVIAIFEKESANILRDLFNEYCSDSFAEGKDDREAIKQELSSLAKEVVADISAKLSFHKLEKAAGKKRALDSLQKYSTRYVNVLFVMKATLTKCAARGYVSNMLDKELENANMKERLITAYIEDLILARKAKTKKSGLTLAESILFKKYFTVNSTNLSWEVTNSFLKFQKVNSLLSLRSFRRPTLGKHSLLASNNPRKFYAHLRLSNRSCSRDIANSRHAFFNKTDRVASRVWRLSDTSCDHTDVHETQTILKSFGRRDRVDDVGNYASIYEEIKQIKDYFQAKGEEIGDAEVAEWIQDIFQGTFAKFSADDPTEAELLHKLQSITYLLLGCEAVRNPAMHVVNQMLLDLIIGNNKWSFKEALTGEKENDSKTSESIRRMPMAPEGAVAIARYLTSDYRKLMPHSYFYRGIEDKGESRDKFNKQDLIELEATIVRDWLKLTKANIKATNSSQFIERVSEHIENHFKVWLGEEASLEVDDLAREMRSLRLK